MTDVLGCLEGIQHTYEVPEIFWYFGIKCYSFVGLALNANQ